MHPSATPEALRPHPESAARNQPATRSLTTAASPDDTASDSSRFPHLSPAAPQLGVKQAVAMADAFGMSCRRPHTATAAA